MTVREQEVLELIKKNPMISYGEIAEKLGISKSTVAVYIASLTSQGEIIGKQFVLAEDYVVCIGTSVADVFGFYASKGMNGGKVKLASGGVARNIAENLARLGDSVKLLSIVGDDKLGDVLLNDSATSGIDVSAVGIKQGASTPTFLQLIDADGNGVTTVMGRDGSAQIDIEYLKMQEHIISNARLILIADVNPTIVGYINERFPNKKIYMDMSMVNDLSEIQPYIKCIYSIQGNKQEVETLTGIKIRNDDTLNKAADYLIRKGVHRVVITLGTDGAFYKDADGFAIRRRTKTMDNVVNATGAGDAFSAGYIHCLMGERSPVYAVDFAMACAILALSSDSSINPNMCTSLAEQTMLEYIEEG